MPGAATEHVQVAAVGAGNRHWQKSVHLRVGGQACPAPGWEPTAENTSFQVTEAVMAILISY